MIHHLLLEKHKKIFYVRGEKENVKYLYGFFTNYQHLQGWKHFTRSCVYIQWEMSIFPIYFVNVGPPKWSHHKHRITKKYRYLRKLLSKSPSWKVNKSTCFQADLFRTHKRRMIDNLRLWQTRETIEDDGTIAVGSNVIQDWMSDANSDEHP